MTESQLTHLEATVGQRGNRPYHDPVWIKAFEEHNKNNQHLSLGCGGCYDKVLKWHKEQTAG